MRVLCTFAGVCEVGWEGGGVESMLFQFVIFDINGLIWERHVTYVCIEIVLLLTFSYA